MIDKIKQLAHEFQPEAVVSRRHLHKYPSLSFMEQPTTHFVYDRLSEWNIECRYCMNQTGVIAMIRGKDSGKKTIALRADLDALPITELNKCEYRSSVPGVMHACGHDAHIAMLLGTAKILHQMRTYFEGTVKLIFQPGEEKLPGGASFMIDDGVLNDVDVIIAQHVYPDLPCGEAGFYAGNYMASCDEINITISGKGGHAAKPSERVNTTVAAANVLDALTALSSEFNTQISQDSPVILAFGSFIANGTYNVIPDKVELKGTLRTFDEYKRKQIKNKIRKISSRIAQKFGASSRVIIKEGYPVLINDVNLTESMRRSAVVFLGEDKVKDLPRLMTSEDFAWYAHKIPACFYRLGTSNEMKGIVSKQHTSTFDIDEDALEIGVGLMSYLAIKFLNGNE